VPDDDLVMGESRSLLREALLSIRTERRPDGTLSLEGELPARLADPFQRALERTCDELAEDDRRRGVPVREGGRLRAAALMALLLRVADTAS
jgi:hypothetical protein